VALFERGGEEPAAGLAQEPDDRQRDQWPCGPHPPHSTSRVVTALTSRAAAGRSPWSPWFPAGPVGSARQGTPKRCRARLSRSGRRRRWGRPATGSRRPTPRPRRCGPRRRLPTAAPDPSSCDPPGTCSGHILTLTRVLNAPPCSPPNVRVDGAHHNDGSLQRVARALVCEPPRRLGRAGKSIRFEGYPRTCGPLRRRSELPRICRKAGAICGRARGRPRISQQQFNSSPFPGPMHCYVGEHRQSGA
jgi:hypothetical protein